MLQTSPAKTERAEFLEELVKLIKEANSIAVLTHTAADGDALGSSFSLALALETMGKKVSVFLEEPVPKMLIFLPGQHLVSEKRNEAFELAMCLDTSDMKRLGTRADIYEHALKKITIDHNKKKNMEADDI